MRRRALLAASTGGGIITFYLKSPNPENPILVRQAVKDMTWGEWIQSDFNTIYEDQCFESFGDCITHYEEGWYVTYPQGGYVLPNDLIQDGFVYDYV